MISITGKNNHSYEKLMSALKTGDVGNLYFFHGEERYLMERSLAGLRSFLCPDGLDSFNYKRFDGRELSVYQLEEAVSTLPFFTERTMIEVHDFSIFKNDEREILCNIFSDLPDYVCIVFIYSTIEYKPDGRQKITKEILKYADVIEFVVQEQDELIKWINRHFRDTGKAISKSDASYLAFITGGLMATLNGEIEKVAAYSKDQIVTRSDIDAVVTPALDAVIYHLADALVNRENKKALRLLDDLFQMREAPHKLLFSISLKMRQLLAARVCIERKIDKTVYMKMCGIRHDFQARTLFNTAAKSTLSDCRNAVLYCAQTALDLNSTAEPEERMIELITKLALKGKV